MTAKQSTAADTTAAARFPVRSTKPALPSKPRRQYTPPSHNRALSIRSLAPVA